MTAITGGSCFQLFHASVSRVINIAMELNRVKSAIPEYDRHKLAISRFMPTATVEFKLRAVCLFYIQVTSRGWLFPDVSSVYHVISGAEGHLREVQLAFFNMA